MLKFRIISSFFSVLPLFLSIILCWLLQEILAGNFSIFGIGRRFFLQKLLIPSKRCVLCETLNILLKKKSERETEREKSCAIEKERDVDRERERAHKIL